MNDVVNEYNNTYHGTSKMKPVDVKDNTNIDSTEVHSNKEVNDKDPKFKFGDHVRISKYNFFLLKDTHQIGLKNVLQIKNLKMQFHGHMLLVI